MRSIGTFERKMKGKKEKIKKISRISSILIVANSEIGSWSKFVIELF